MHSAVFPISPQHRLLPSLSEPSAYRLHHIQKRHLPLNYDLRYGGLDGSSHHTHHTFLQILPRFIAHRHLIRIRYRHVHQILPDSHISHNHHDSPRKIRFLGRPSPGHRSRNTAVGIHSLNESFRN